MPVRTLPPLLLVAGPAVVLGLACKDSGPEAFTEAQKAAARREILRTLDGYFAAVNARDPQRFLTFFVTTEDLTVIEDKDQRLSRKAFVAFVDSFFKEVAEIQATWDTRGVFPLAPGVAVVTGTFHVAARDAKGAPMAFRNAFTLVLVSREGGWLVKHVHESSLEP